MTFSKRSAVTHFRRFHFLFIFLLLISATSEPDNCCLSPRKSFSNVNHFSKQNTKQTRFRTVVSELRRKTSSLCEKSFLNLSLKQVSQLLSRQKDDKSLIFAYVAYKEQKIRLKLPGTYCICKQTQMLLMLEILLNYPKHNYAEKSY